MSRYHATSLVVCDHGGPLSHMFHSLVRKQNVNLGRPQVWKEIAKS